MDRFSSNFGEVSEFSTIEPVSCISVTDRLPLEPAVFTQSENLNMRQLCDEFEGYGVHSLNKLGNLIAEDSQMKEIVMSGLTDALNVIRSFRQGREELESLNARLKSDVQSIDRDRDRMAEDLLDARHEVDMLRERERQHRDRANKLEKDITKANEEVIKFKSAMAHKDSAYKHELKRRETECAKLKDRLTHVLNDRKVQNKAGTAVINQIQQSRTTGAVIPAVNPHEQLCRAVAASYEERLAELLDENTLLRNALYSMQRELVQVLNDQQQQTTEDEIVPLCNENTEPEALSTGHFKLPFALVKEEIEGNLNQLWTKLRQGMSATVTAQSEPNNSSLDAALAEINQLTAQLEGYQSLIKHQEQLLVEQDQKTAVEVKSHGFNDFLNDSYLADEKENLERERAHLNMQKRHMEEERFLVANATANILKERVQLEQSRRQFDMDRLAFIDLQQQLQLALTHKPKPVAAPGTPKEKQFGASVTRSPLASLNNIGNLSSVKKAAHKTSTPCFSPRGVAGRTAATPLSMRLRAADISTIAAQNMNDTEFVEQVWSNSDESCGNPNLVRALFFQDENTHLED